MSILQPYSFTQHDSRIQLKNMKYLALAQILFFIGCSSKKCDEIVFKPIFYLPYSSDYTVISHYLYSKDYDSDCYENIDFYNIAKIYSDSINDYLPIQSIIFVSSDEGLDYANREMDGNTVERNTIYVIPFKYSKLDNKSYIIGKALIAPKSYK